MDESLHDERITGYIDNTLNKIERATFEKELEKNAVLKQQLEDRMLAIEAVKQAGVFNSVKLIHAEMMQELRPSPGRIVEMRRWSRKGFSIAASIILVIMAAGAIYVYSLSPQKLYSEAFVDFELSGSRGAGEINTPTAERYRLGQFEAIARSTNENRNAKDSLLKGLAYMKLGLYDRAALWLDAIRTPSNPYKEDGDFYLALAYLQQKNYEPAIQLLTAIRSDENHLYYHQVSPALIRKISVLEWKE